MQQYSFPPSRPPRGNELARHRPPSSLSRCNEIEQSLLAPTPNCFPSWKQVRPGEMEDDSTSGNDAVSQLEETQKTLQFVMQELDNALKSNEKLRTKIYKLKNRMRLPPFRKSPAEEKVLLAQMSKPRPRSSFESSPLPPRLQEKLRNSISNNRSIDQSNSTSESSPTKKRKRIRKLKDAEQEEEESNEDPFADLREPLPCLPAEVIRILIPFFLFLANLERRCYIFSYCPRGDVFRSISFVSQEFRSFSLSSVREIRIHNRDYNHEGALHLLLQSMQSCFPSLKALDISWCNKIRKYFGFV